MQYLFAYGTLRRRAVDQSVRILKGFKLFAPINQIVATDKAGSSHTSEETQFGYPCAYFGNSADYIYGNLIKVGDKVEDWTPYDTYESEGSLYDRINVTQAVEDQGRTEPWGLGEDDRVHLYVAGEHLMRYKWKSIGSDWLSPECSDAECKDGSEIAYNHRIYKTFFYGVSEPSYS